jgi:hypothetical protein
MVCCLDNPEKSIDDEIWLAYFSELSTVPPKFDKKIEELNKKVKELEQKPEFKSFSCLDFRISASELNKAICNLKNGKSPGLDMIGNDIDSIFTWIVTRHCGPARNCSKNATVFLLRPRPTVTVFEYSYTCIP